MIISRGLRLLKAATTITKQRCSSNIMQVRNSGHEVTYRECPDASLKERIVTELLAGFAWWWILWHCWHDFSHIVGEFPYPEPSEWTDEELGIPTDDYD